MSLERKFCSEKANWGIPSYLCSPPTKSSHVFSQTWNLEFSFETEHET